MDRMLRQGVNPHIYSNKAVFFRCPHYELASGYKDHAVHFLLPPVCARELRGNERRSQRNV